MTGWPRKTARARRRLIPSPRLDRGPGTEHLGGPHNRDRRGAFSGRRRNPRCAAVRAKLQGSVLGANVTIRAVRERGQYIAETITAEGR